MSEMSDILEDELNLYAWRTCKNLPGRNICRAKHFDSIRFRYSQREIPPMDRMIDSFDRD